MDCQPSVTNWQHFGISELLFSVTPRWQTLTFDSLRTHRDGIFGPTENPNVHYIWTFGLTEFSLRSDRDWSNVCVTVGFCVEAIYTPPPPLHSWGEPSESTTTSTIHFLRSEPPTLVLRSSHSIPTIWNLISSLPKLLSTQTFLPPQPYQWGELSVGEFITWSTRARSSSSSTPSITFWGVVPPRLVRCRLGASVFEMWSWTKKFVRARRSPTSWRSTPSKASPPWA